MIKMYGIVMNKFIYKSLLTSFIITTVFLLLNVFEYYLERRFIGGYQKIFLKVPMQFILLFVVSMLFLYLFSRIFKVR